MSSAGACTRASLLKGEGTAQCVLAGTTRRALQRQAPLKEAAQSGPPLLFFFNRKTFHCEKHLFLSHTDLGFVPEGKTA